jgi:hypothetical protein
MATINGKVVRNSGTRKLSVRNVPVAICSASVPHPDLAAVTDDKGRFRLGGLSPGTYVVGAQGTEIEVALETEDACIGCDIVVNASKGNDAADLVKATSTHNDQTSETFARASGANPAQTAPTENDAPQEEVEDFSADPYGREEENAPIEEAGVLRTGLVYAALSLRLAAGQRDRNKLTDVAYGVLHPEEELPFSTDDPDFDEKSKAWLNVRSEFVDKLLADLPQPEPDVTSVTEFGLTFERMPDGPTHKVRRNGKNWALPEVIDAMRDIAQEWNRRHDDIELVILDISKPEGGRIYPPHKSHAVGLDVDCQLRIGNRKLCMNRAQYAEWRPLWQEFCNIARQNGVLPINAIGFSDPEVTGVSHWRGHTCHVHLRFCAPPDKIDAVETAVDAIYADQPRSKRPRYRCRASAFEAAPQPIEDTRYEFFPHEFPEAAGGLETAGSDLNVVQRGMVYAAIGLVYSRGIRPADKLTDEGWKIVFPDAEFPLRSWHTEFARKRRVWLEIREMVRGFLDALPNRQPEPPAVPAICRNAGLTVLRRLAREAEAAGAPEGFATFAEGAAWTESRWNNCALNSSASEAAAARDLFVGARRRGWFPDTSFGEEDFAFGSGGWFGFMAATGLIAGGNRGPFINADPRLVTDPAASIVMLADFMMRVFRKYDARDFLAIRRAMAALSLVHDFDEERERSVLVRDRFEAGLRKADVADPAAFMSRRPSIGAYPGAWALWAHLKFVSTE